MGTDLPTNTLKMSRRDHAGPPHPPPYVDDPGGRSDPFLSRGPVPMGSAESTTNQILQVRLQAHDLLGQALEMENSVLQAEIHRLQGCLDAAPRSYGLSVPSQLQPIPLDHTSWGERN